MTQPEKPMTDYFTMRVEGSESEINEIWKKVGSVIPRSCRVLDISRGKLSDRHRGSPPPKK